MSMDPQSSRESHRNSQKAWLPQMAVEVASSYPRRYPEQKHHSPTQLGSHFLKHWWSSRERKSPFSGTM